MNWYEIRKYQRELGRIHLEHHRSYRSINRKNKRCKRNYDLFKVRLFWYKHWCKNGLMDNSNITSLLKYHGIHIYPFRVPQSLYNPHLKEY